MCWASSHKTFGGCMFRVTYERNHFIATRDPTAYLHLRGAPGIQQYGFHFADPSDISMKAWAAETHKHSQSVGCPFWICNTTKTLLAPTHHSDGLATIKAQPTTGTWHIIAGSKKKKSCIDYKSLSEYLDNRYLPVVLARKEQKGIWKELRKGNGRNKEQLLWSFCL